MLTSIELTGFRGFRQLKLEGLQRVNLIVGKNNSGKTSLLEGIEILGDFRGAVDQASLRLPESGLNKAYWYINDECMAQGAKVTGEGAGGNYAASFGENNKASSTGQFRVVAVPVYAKQTVDLVQSLGRAIKTRGVEELIEANLSKVDDRIKKIRISPGPEGNQVVLDIGLSELVPVSMVGQGVYRLLEIFSEIIGAKAKVCLIDEIENGIHHSSLIDLWRGLADAAERFGVQIFATTHSHECVEAAHDAFSERPSYDLSVIQLFRKTISVQGRVLDQAHITAAMAGEIDLRG